MIDLDAVFVPGLVGGSLIAEIIQPGAREIGKHFGRAEAGVLGGNAAEPARRNLVAPLPIENAMHFARALRC